MADNENIKLGIDFGGSGIKGALVNIETGEVVSDRHRIPTPVPATPESVSKTMKEIVDFFEYRGEVGFAFPSAIQNDIVRTASNIDKSWIGTNVKELFDKTVGVPTFVLNDADAAGMAEMRFGHGKELNGLVIIITVGTGIGTALFVNKVLVPNTELGHIYYKKKIAEDWVSDAIRKRYELPWHKWAKRFDKYLHYMEKLFYPEKIIIGGGISKKFHQYSEYLVRTESQVVPAHLQNFAGIIGAAVSTL